MEQELTLHIVLENPPAGVDYGLQKGQGKDYEITQKQRSSSGNLHFEFAITIRKNKNAEPGFYGPFVQGPPTERFIYIGIGAFAGQTDSTWSRRLKIPLKGITWQMIDQAAGSMLTTNVPGTGKDGSPTCATVKPFSGWGLTSHI